MPHKPEDQDDSAKKPSATGRALRLLGHKARSAAELRAALAEEGYGEAELDEALRATCGWGYVHDGRLAEGLAHAALRRGRGARWLAQRLATRKLGTDDAQRVTREHTAHEPELIAELLERRFASRGLLATPQGQRRALRFLLGRGFAPGQVAQAVRQAAQRAPAVLDDAELDALDQAADD